MEPPRRNCIYCSFSLSTANNCKQQSTIKHKTPNRRTANPNARNNLQMEHWNTLLTIGMFGVWWSVLKLFPRPNGTRNAAIIILCSKSAPWRYETGAKYFMHAQYAIACICKQLSDCVLHTISLVRSQHILKMVTRTTLPAHRWIYRTNSCSYTHRHTDCETPFRLRNSFRFAYIRYACNNNKKKKNRLKNALSLF